jgi:diguanylate cyclase (GGDEF)-like protein
MRTFRPSYQTPPNAMALDDGLTGRGENRARAAWRRRVTTTEAREAAAQDREQTARELLQVRSDRDALTRELAIAQADPLTGARTRASGLSDLERELSRCRRTNIPLVIAYVDVVGLKRLNDREGHAAGDELLKRIVRQITDRLRPYDLIIRLGGDEFLCVMSDMTMPEARQRFGDVAATLAAAPDPGAVRTGFAAFTPLESAADLIARADSELVAGRSSRTSGLGPTPQATRRQDGDENRPATALSLAICGGALAPGRARAALAALAEDVGPRQHALLALLITELVTNSVIHGGAGPLRQITIQVTVRAHAVHGEVSDSGPGFRAEDRFPSREAGGLGLVIVERSASRWGATHEGRRVWFELDRRSEQTEAPRAGDMGPTGAQAPVDSLVRRHAA